VTRGGKSKDASRTLSLTRVAEMMKAESGRKIRVVFPGDAPEAPILVSFARSSA
jgi:hypothetical protein